jgi:chromate transporter
VSILHTLQMFLLMLKASLFSTGGTGNLPSVHADFTALHWANERQFAEALGIAQIAPGPNGLWVVSLGYLSYGLPGALAGALAVTIPPISIVAVARLYERVQRHPAMEGFIFGLTLGVAGVSVVVLGRLFMSVGPDRSSIAIALGAVLLAWTRRVPIVAIIGLAALAGALLTTTGAAR